MKPLSPTLSALLATRQFFAVNLYTLTLIDGSITRYCSGDADIVAGGNTYSAGGSNGALFELSGDEADATWRLGTEVETFTVNVTPRAATLVTVPWIIACRYGVLDGALLTWSIAFMPTYGDVAGGGVALMFTGRIIDFPIADQVVTLNVNSPMELLNQNLPRNLFTPGCINTLYDTACTLLPASFSSAVTVTGGTTTTILVSGASGRATGYFDQGTISFATGPNAGASRTVRAWTNPGTAVIFPPLPVAPAVGNTGTMYAGCDLLQGTCLAKFANLANFRGFPTVPQPETAI